MERSSTYGFSSFRTQFTLDRLESKVQLSLVLKQQIPLPPRNYLLTSVEYLYRGLTILLADILG